MPPSRAVLRELARDAQERHGIEFIVRRRVLNLDLIHPDTEFLGQHHARARVNALTHFDVRHYHPHGAVRVDADEGIGSEGRVAVGGRGCRIARLAPRVDGGIYRSAGTRP